MNTQSQQTLVPRPPIIAVMGHIDHGKSTLLDSIRKSNTVETEAGGITQHTSAYEVIREKDGKEERITFLDTPGHEAFKAMRSRGATVADIAILVVAADDGVKPQTKEAHQAIRESGIPFIVAINKIDKPGADIDRTINTLIENEIYLEGHGGDVPYVALSAKTGENMDELLDIILLVAELKELKGDSNKPAEGVVIESHIDPKKGTSATLVIKNGTLKGGMFIVVGSSIASVRAIEDFTGATIKEASFSSPVILRGFDSAPAVGALFQSFSSRKEAEEKREEKDRGTERIQKTQEEEERLLVTIPLVIKSDTTGTLEAVEFEVKKLESEDVSLPVIYKGIGALSEGDIRSLGESKGAHAIAFNVKVERAAEDLAQRLAISIGSFGIIYDITKWLSTEIEAKKESAHKEMHSGVAHIIKIFSKEGNKQIVGGRVATGKLVAGDTIRLKRRDAVIAEGKIIELQHMKEKVGEVSEGKEFGARIDVGVSITTGDTIEATVHI